MRAIVALICGLIFGFGLLTAEMTNPAKVLNFLDITDIGGMWDPSLVFVLGAAVVVTFIGFRLAFARGRPVFADSFQTPTSKRLDIRLLGGAVLFGAGWGLVGLCPGPALAAALIGGAPVLIFLGAMLAGMLLVRLSQR